jgi:pimeloyl-ACP methyl ester carboxylesterase
MKKEYIKINTIPAIIWGEPSKNVYVAIHGQGGNKEEAKLLYGIVAPNAQVISIDLPKHGERTDAVNFLPWEVIVELQQVIQYTKKHWQTVSLYANSIGALFSMLSYKNETFEKVLFVSPILDMNVVITNMMKQNHISEERLQKEQVIPTNGEPLSWEYLSYIREHPITHWLHPTNILYSKNDCFIDYDTVTTFCERFHCQLTAIEDGEHWFHTKEQLACLHSWIITSI